MRWLLLSAVFVLSGGCSALAPTQVSHPGIYSLDEEPQGATGSSREGAISSESAVTLVVSPPDASAGFDSKHMVYVREAHRLEYFSRHEWVDTPARMLAPLMIAAIEKGGMFRAVVLTPSAAAGDFILDTEVVRFVQDFSVRPSRFRFTMRAVMTDRNTRRVLVSRQFDAVVVATSDDPVGGVAAANRAVQQVLVQLASFGDEAVRQQSRCRGTMASMPVEPGCESASSR